VIVLDLGAVRGGAAAIADLLTRASGGLPIVVDAVTEHDLRALALGLEEAERRGAQLLYRVGPPFVRARIGQEARAPLSAEEARSGRPQSGSGLVVIGSHVGLATRQLRVLQAGHPARVVELHVEKLLDAATAADELDAVVGAVVAGLADGEVVLHTSRELVRADSAAESLRIAPPCRPGWSTWCGGCSTGARPGSSSPRAGSPRPMSRRTGCRSAARSSAGRCCPGSSRSGSPSRARRRESRTSSSPGTWARTRSLLDVVRVLAAAG
jgi:hypothetical protein